MINQRRSTYPDREPVQTTGATSQRQAAPLRFKASLDPHTKRVTLTALLGACGTDLQDLRDAALLSLGYDAVLRVSELVAVTVAHIDPHSDGSALLFIPSSKTDQEGQGAWGWLSADTMRRVGAWLVASAITEGPIFRRVGIHRRRLRAAVPPMAYEAIPGHTRHWQEKLKGKKAEPVDLRRKPDPASSGPSRCYLFEGIGSGGFPIGADWYRLLR